MRITTTCKVYLILLSSFLGFPAGWFVGSIARAQFPYSGTRWSLSSSATAPGPLGTPGVMWYWNYTNNIQSTFVTNWIDQIASVAFLWNTTKAANTRPTNSTTGVYFDGFNFGQNLTNAPLVDIVNSSMSNIWLYVSFKPNHFSGATITMWGDSGTVHGYLQTASDKIVRFNPSGTAIAVTTALASLTEYDLSLCVSNGIIWSWTNGIASLVAGAQGFASGRNFDPVGLAGDKNNANWYDGFIQEVAAGTNGFGGQFFGGVQASNLHWWRTNAVIFSSP